MACLHESSSLDNTGIVLGGPGSGPGGSLGVYKLSFVFFRGTSSAKSTASTTARRVPQIHLSLDGEPLASTISAQKKDRHVIFHDTAYETEVFDIYIMIDQGSCDDRTAQDSGRQSRGVLQVSFSGPMDEPEVNSQPPFSTSNAQLRGLLTIKKVF